MERFGLSSEAVRMLDSGIEWVTLFQQGRIQEAYLLLGQGSPLPEMTSHIRDDAENEDDLSLRQLQYMVAWTARDMGLTGVRIPDVATGLRIAVAGGGPAGLAATVRLLEKGYTVNLFDREEKLGGAPALVYSEDRLPDPSGEIYARLESALQVGRLTISLGREALADALIKRHDAVLMATGCWNEPTLGVAENIWSALRFLKTVREGRCTSTSKTVTILCGGDAAMDAAVVAKKLGAEHIVLLFDCPKQHAHWHLPESWFNTRGVSVQYDIHPKGYRVDANRSVSGVLLEGGETVETEMVIEAMGLFADTIDTEPEGIFTAGAVVNGGASVQQCIQEGFAASEEIDRYLKGKAT